MESIEAENAKEEIKEEIEKCMNCGLCKADCPVFKVMREETYSPRGKVLILKQGIYEKIFYDCCLCGNCEKNCPVGVKLKEVFRKARVVLAGTGKEPRQAREILKEFDVV